MERVTGIHSVDFKLQAEGHGCVNWNGSIGVRGDGGKEIKNHSIPKLRGFSNKTGKISDKGYEYKVSAHDIDLSENPMYVSTNCLRYHIFKKEMPHHLGKTNKDMVENLITSLAGITRGFALTTGYAPTVKKSCLLLEDLVCDSNVKSNFEYFTTNSSKLDSETGGFYSKTTVGDTKYTGYGSINIEELQFISCDGIFGRSAIDVKQGEDFAQKCADTLSSNLNKIAGLLGVNATNPTAEYNPCWVRKGSMMEIGEAGILLNNDAISVVVAYLMSRIQNLYIHQAKGWLSVTDLHIDYNDGPHMRIKRGLMGVQNNPGNFAVYYRKGSSVELERSNAAKEFQDGANGKTKKKRKASKKDA